MNNVQLFIMTITITQSTQPYFTSMTNCPAYVPVIVELWPAAKIPRAQIYMDGGPNSQPRNTPWKHRTNFNGSSVIDEFLAETGNKINKKGGGNWCQTRNQETHPENIDIEAEKKRMKINVYCHLDESMTVLYRVVENVYCISIPWYSTITTVYSNYNLGVWHN